MASRILQFGVAGGAFALLSVMTGAQTTASASQEVQSAGTVAATTAVMPAIDGTPDPVRHEETSTVSQVRIVRLSLVRGIVQMDRNTGRGFETAFANIPVVAGSRLRTGQGVAEVELEDNSSLRLAPNSEVQFLRLGRTAAGTTVTTVDMGEGTVYVALEKTKGNEFALTSAGARVDLQPGAHLRLGIDGGKAQLAMFDGSAQLQMGSSITSLAKKQTVVLTPATQTASSVTKGTEESEWDGWDKQESDYHKQKASFAGTNGSALYGANDLSYYGSFVDMPGCGSMWRPYFASAAWDPFASGVWAWYPSAGYSWVSPYPWGWLPFHSGTWASCGGAGWGWRPGSSWYGVNNLQAIRIANHPLPHPVPPVPVRTAATLVPVNMKQLAVSGPSQGEAFTFRRDSAGLGVPRTAFGNLHHVADHVNQQGAVTQAMPMGTFTTMPASGREVGGTMNGNRAGSISSSNRSAYTGLSSNGVSRSAPSAGGMHSASAGAPSGGAGHK